jgi:hypothetical protein
MSHSSEALVYGGVKLLSYCLYCALGIKLADPDAFRSSAQRAVWRAVRLGSLRWVLGLGFGIVIFFAFQTTPDRLWTQYVSVYVPVRIIEWAIIAWLLHSEHMHRRSSLWYGWIAGGVLVSFASDFTSPEMIEEGRFCVGRCLC